MKKILSLLAMILLLSCNNKTTSCTKRPTHSETELSAKEREAISSIETLTKEEGLQRLQTNCYPCHNPNSESHDRMIAPPLAGIKHNYKNLYPNEELFIAKMASFVNSPNEDNAVMRGPVRRFGLMPKTSLSQIEIQELVKYIYNNNLEAPDWFPEHFEEHHNTKWTEKS